ncbi:hypothetical protein [Flavobacterium sp. 3HN19-14]|uniref:hypothetical protein n=1 Tax=Flavobacterium sp. 3HN19-14 TaxID=3448133 RepID=UPI003EE1AEED
MTAANIHSGFMQTKLPDVKIDINCIFMKASPLRVDWTLNVLDKTDGFNIKGRILNFDASAMEPFVKPYMNITTNGILKEVYFNFTGNDISSQGDFAVKYDDLKVKVFRKKNPDKKNGFMTAIANLLVKNDTKGELVSTEVSVKRIPNTSFYNFLWRNIQEGLKKIMI